MARPAPTHPEDLPAIEKIEATAGPRETTVYNDRGVLTVIPTRCTTLFFAAGQRTVSVGRSRDPS